MVPVHMGKYTFFITIVICTPYIVRVYLINSVVYAAGY